VLVLGVTGVAGLMAVQNARLLGADRVIAAGRGPERLARAAGLGAAATATLAGDPGADGAALAAALDGAAPGLILDCGAPRRRPRSPR
jgi:threonine dehydrogenase-like Zn-dependent dehydrogenase